MAAPGNGASTPPACRIPQTLQTPTPQRAGDASRTEFLRPADMGIAAEIERSTRRASLVSPIRVLSPTAPRRCRRSPARAAQGAEIDAIQRKIDGECLGEAPGPAGQIQMSGDAAPRLHLGDALDRFQRADQHPCRRYAGNRPRSASSRCRRRYRHRRAPAAGTASGLRRRRPPKGVAGGIVLQIGLRSGRCG